jgi:hypothetical protein
MPAKSRNRQILLVGSVPLANAKEVFSESAARLGELIPRIPDGETGVRTMWILCQKEVMAKAKNLKMHHQFDIAPGVAQTVYEVADLSKPVEFPALNYAAAAKDSYRQFTELKKAGKIAATTKFQVSLPTAVAVLSGFIVSESSDLGLSVELANAIVERSSRRYSGFTCRYRGTERTTHISSRRRSFDYPQRPSSISDLFISPMASRGRVRGWKLRSGIGPNSALRANAASVAAILRPYFRC